MLVRMLVAAACIPALAACARRPVHPETAAVAIPGRAKTQNPPRRAHLQERGCQPQLIGLGDTWLTTEVSPARMNCERSRYGAQPGSKPSRKTTPEAPQRSPTPTK